MNELLTLSYLLAQIMEKRHIPSNFCFPLSLFFVFGYISSTSILARASLSVTFLTFSHQQPDNIVYVMDATFDQVCESQLGESIQG